MNTTSWIPVFTTWMILNSQTQETTQIGDDCSIWGWVVAGVLGLACGIIVWFAFKD